MCYQACIVSVASVIIPFDLDVGSSRSHSVYDGINFNLIGSIGSVSGSECGTAETYFEGYAGRARNGNIIQNQRSRFVTDLPAGRSGPDAFVSRGVARTGIGANVGRPHINGEVVVGCSFKTLKGNDSAGLLVVGNGQRGGSRHNGRDVHPAGRVL